MDKDDEIRMREFGDGFDKYEKTLRTWFVAYGVGFPVLFLTQPDLRERFVTNPDGLCIWLLFLVGVFAQIFESLVYKMITWYPYYRVLEQDTSIHWWYKFSDYVHEHYWIDLAFDLLTISAFFCATIKALPIVFKK